MYSEPQAMRLTEDDKRIRRRVTIALATLPFVIAFFVVGGLFLGFYVSDVLGITNRAILGLIFATVGLAISIIVSYLAAKMVSYA